MIRGGGGKYNFLSALQSLGVFVGPGILAEI